ncbi:MAG: pilus assembly PilX N-terminal domain-containing protein [Candidatus Eremiobacterota bacterium]
MKKKINHELGIIMISVLLLLTVFIVLTTSMLYISTYHLQLIGNIETQENAKNAARAGVEYVISKLTGNAAWGLYDPATGWIDAGGPPSVTVKFPETKSEFFITFNPDQKTYKYSCNNLFFSNQKARKNPDCNIPPYNFDVIVYGKCGDITKILRVFLVRDDVYPYNLNTSGRISFMDAKTITFSGENSDGKCGPGTVYSTWNNKGLPSFHPDYYSIQKGNALTQLITHDGTFYVGTNGKANLLGNYDCQIKTKDVEMPMGTIDIEKDILKGIKTRVDKGDKSIAKISGPSEIIVTEDPYTRQLSLKNKAGGPSALPSDAYKIEGDTIKLIKDVYVEEGSVKTSGQKNLWIGDAQVLNNSLIFKKSNEVLFKTDEEGNSKPRYIKINLNDHAIYSKTHMHLGVEVSGQGGLVSAGKLTYLQGFNTQNVVSVSDDDLDIELSKNSAVNMAKGLFYSNDDFRVKPIANGNPIYGDDEEPSIRNKLTLPEGTTMGNASETTEAPVIVGDASLTQDYAWIRRYSKYGYYYWSYELCWIPQVTGDYRVNISRIENKDASTYLKVGALQDFDGTEESLKVYEGFLSPYPQSDYPTKPDLSGKNIDFGEYELAIFRKSKKGEYDIGAVKNGKLLCHALPPPLATPTPDPEATPDPDATPTPEPEEPKPEPLLNGDLLKLTGFPDITEEQLAKIGTRIGDRFYSKLIDKASIEGVIVSHNNNPGDYEGGTRSIELDIANPDGKIDIKYNKEYMSILNRLRGYNLGTVRVNCWQELK